MKRLSCRIVLVCVSGMREKKRDRTKKKPDECEPEWDREGSCCAAAAAVTEQYFHCRLVATAFATALWSTNVLAPSFFPVSSLSVIGMAFSCKWVRKCHHIWLHVFDDANANQKRYSNEAQRWRQQQQFGFDEWNNGRNSRNQSERKPNTECVFVLPLNAKQPKIKGMSWKAVSITFPIEWDEKKRAHIQKRIHR